VSSKTASYNKTVANYTVPDRQLNAPLIEIQAITTGRYHINSNDPDHSLSSLILMILLTAVKQTRIIAVTFTMILALSTIELVSGNQEREYKQNIENIGKEIKQISRNLNANKTLLKSTRDQLLEIEQNISEVSKSIQRTDVKIAQQRQKNTNLQTQIEQLKAQQVSDKERLSALLVNRYKKGQPNYMKMVLDQQNPYAVGRLGNYYGYFTRAIHQELKSLRQQLDLIANMQQERQSVLLELEQQRQQQRTQEQTLRQQQQRRQQSINKLNAKVERSSEKLEKLRQDRSRLNRLLKQIALQAEKLRVLEQQRIEQERIRQQGATGKPADGEKPVLIRPLVPGGFIKQRGRLRYPVAGTQKYRFGSRLAASGMRAEGVFFDTRGMQPVKSIFRGRVLFADFLKRLWFVDNYRPR